MPSSAGRAAPGYENVMFWNSMLLLTGGRATAFGFSTSIGLLQHFEDSFGRRVGLLDLGPDVAGLPRRLGGGPQEDQQGQELRAVQLLGRDPFHPHDQRGAAGSHSQHFEHRLGSRVHLRHVEQLLEQPVIDVPELLLLVLFLIVHLDDPQPGHRLLQLGQHLGAWRPGNAGWPSSSCGRRSRTTRPRGDRRTERRASGAS